MIYQPKPQRGGRSIPTNTNNPPQDPPPHPKVTKKPEIVTLSIIQKISRFLKKIFRRV